MSGGVLINRVSHSSVPFLQLLALSSRSNLLVVTAKGLVLWALIVCGILLFFSGLRGVVHPNLL